MKEYIKAIVGSTKTLVDYFNEVLKNGSVEIDSNKEFLGDRILETYVNNFLKNLTYIKVCRTVVHGVPAIECKSKLTGGCVLIYLDQDGTVGEFDCQHQSDIFEFDSYIDQPEVEEDEELSSNFVPNLGRYNTNKPFVSELDCGMFIKKAKKWLLGNGVVKAPGFNNEETIELLVKEYFKQYVPELGNDQQYWTPTNVDFKHKDKVVSVQVILENGNVGYLYFNNADPHLYIPLQGNWRAIEGNKFNNNKVLPALINSGILSLSEVKSMGEEESMKEGLKRIKAQYYYNDPNILKPSIDKAYEEWLTITNQCKEPVCTRFVDPYSIAATESDILKKLLNSLQEYKELTVVEAVIKRVEKELASRNYGVGGVWTDGVSFWKITNNVDGRVSYTYLKKENDKSLKYETGTGDEELSFNNEGVVVLNGSTELVKVGENEWNERKLVNSIIKNQ